MRRVTKENLIAQIERLRKIKDEQGQLSMSGKYTLQAYEMLLATMEVEPVEMPLDYLQGHKDGLEWASQLAETNHPETGDWLYDDPIELAKAIRKGPDMPPVQPAPVVPDDVLKALQKVARIRLDMDGFDGDRRGIADCLCDAEEALIEVVNRRAVMLAAAPHDTPALNSLQRVVTVPGKWIPVSERMPESGIRVLLYFPYYAGHMEDGFIDDVGDGPCHYLFDGDSLSHEPTHWMPLPAAPQEEKP